MKAYWKKYDEEIRYCETPNGFVVAANGIIMGLYSGMTIEESLDRYAQDTGYKSYKELKNITIN